MSFGRCVERVYQNEGNLALLNLLELPRPGRALDCGCGSGDNARALASLGWEVTGITISPDEQLKASLICRKVYVHDLDHGLPPDIGGPYTLIVFSHVLEHLRDPNRVLRDAQRVLASDGQIAVALPNTLNWRQRFHFVIGRFEYDEGGIMDDTHLRFYTFQSGKRLLEATGFDVVQSTVDGSFPLRYIRRLMPGFARYIDFHACRLWPGLFGWQLLYVARTK